MKGLGLKDGWMVKSPVVSRRKQVHHGLSVFFDNKNVLGSNGSVVKRNSDNVPKKLKMETPNILGKGWKRCFLVISNFSYPS